jgi:hypothetical protein
MIGTPVKPFPSMAPVVPLEYVIDRCLRAALSFMPTLAAIRGITYRLAGASAGMLL